MRRRMFAKCFGVLAVAVQMMVPLPAAADSPAVNVWRPVAEASGGTIAGLSYLPDQRGMLYFGYPATKSDTSDLRIYFPERRSWEEPLPGRGPHRERGALTTTFGSDGRPGLPAINRPYWMAHQSVYVPTLRKVLFFAGGATFTYDPVSRRWKDLEIPLDKSPPDVMLGSLAWDPVGQRVILFGGGYISAYKSKPTYIKGDVLRGKPWSPDAWTMAEKRATWAFDPVAGSWSRLVTGSASFIALHERSTALVEQVEGLAGAARGIALEYGDRVSGKEPRGIASDIASLAKTLQDLSVRLGKGEGCHGDYELARCRQASGRLQDVKARLEPAVRAMAEGDGWRTLHLLEAARIELVEAAEDVAPSPLPRYYGRLVTDTRNGLLVLFGGHGGDRLLADTWVFDSARNQWRQSAARGHPPPTAMPAMSFDPSHGVTLLDSGWIYDAARDEWRRLPLASPKDLFLPWRALEYDPVGGVHVALTTGDNLFGAHPVRVAQLKLDIGASRPADNRGPRWTWLDDKYSRSWAALPKNQAEYRAKVAAHKALLAKLPVNVWTRIGTEYSAQDRSYGSFALDPVRSQLIFWGGGHSAYMGNEVSQYDIKGNLWLESWSPDMPPWPFGNPDGDGWNPPFYHQLGSAHGYHRYAYSAELDKLLFGAGDRLLVYDPDRMRWIDPPVRKSGEGALGGVVDMSGGAGFHTLSARHWYGGPFGVWQLDASARAISRIRLSDTPFSTNDRSKAVFDPKRKRILFYGARDEQGKLPANQFFSFEIEQQRWIRHTVTVEPPATEAPVSMAWGVAFSPKDNMLMILPGGRKQDTWLLDIGSDRLRKFGPGPVTRNEGTNGLVYSAALDLFLTLEVGSYGTGPVTPHVMRFRP